jgi:hypothetical protein
LSALLVCLVAGPGLAHQTGYEADANRNGYIEVYRTDNFHGDWKAYKMKANEQLRRHTDEPLMRMVSSKAKAELWVHKSSKLSGCFGRFYSYLSRTTVDQVLVSPECPHGFKMRTVFSHEVGHIYGLPAGPPGDGTPEDDHHPCTAYWQNRSVDVAPQLNSDTKNRGCSVEIVGFGSHDLETLAKPG